MEINLLIFHIQRKTINILCSFLKSHRSSLWKTNAEGAIFSFTHPVSNEQVIPIASESHTKLLLPL